MTRSAAAVAAATLPLAFAYQPRAHAARYGALVPDPDKILDLPPGFTYIVLERRGDPMDDGYRVPGKPDGMGAFAGPDNTVIVMRNHECNVADLANGPYKLGQVPPPEAYNQAAMGGVTRLVVDGDSFNRISSNLVLTGTIRNCAGGLSPWGWLSCEENVDANHGYTFLCPIDAATVQAPQRIVGYGRCNHEAACIDPATHIAYLSEDRGDSALYRFVPDAFDAPFVGKLQALRVVGELGFATTAMAVGDQVSIDWVDIDDPDPVADTLRVEAKAKGAAVFVRGEGIWFHDGAVYLCSTSGGPAQAGQIFRVRDVPGPATLELVAQSTDSDVLDKPDNIAVAPWGELFMAEDGGGDNYIRGLTDDGEIFDFARNAGSSSEFAGVCFSPDGRAMFVNIQSDGLTLVITGPFPEAPDDDDSSSSGDDDGDETTTTTASDSSSGEDTSAPTTGSGADTGEVPTTGAPATTTASASGPGIDTGTDGSSDTGVDPEADGDDAGCGCDTRAPSALTGLQAVLGVAALVGLDRHGRANS